MKFKTLLFGALAFFALNTMAEEVTEGFESVTIVDANGDAVNGSYNVGVGLSNGWQVVGGGICAAADYSDYGFWTTRHSGSKSLTAQYGSSNAAIVVIPQLVSGNFTFWARKTSTSSSTKGYVYLYKMTQSGDTFVKGDVLLNSPTLTTTWTEYTVDLGEEPVYVGINMVRAGMDDVVYNTASLDTHEHSYATEWSSDENEHWHACTSTTGICDAKKTDVAAHDGLICSVCGYKASGIETFPWINDFEGLASGIPAGWDNSEGSATNRKWALYNSYSEGRSLRFDSYNNNEGVTNVLATPWLFIPAEGVYELKFKVKNPNGGDYSVQIGEYGSAERTTLFDNLTSIAKWTEKRVTLESYAGKAVKIYFCGTSNYGSNDAYLYLDDVVVQEHFVHVHQYAETWSIDYTSHWHACLNEVGDCDAPVADKASHSLDENGVCTVCGYDLPFHEDFEHNAPSWWSGSSDWGFKNFIHDGVTSKMAYSGRSTTPLVTSLLKAKKDEVIQFNMLREWEDEVFKVEWSINDSEEWHEILSTTKIGTTKIDEYTTQTWTAPEDGNYRLRFAGSYYAIDNLTGFKLAPETRATAENRFGTICLPYDAKVEGAALYTATLSDNGNWLELTEATELKAGVAYIYQATADAQTFNMGGAATYAPLNEGVLKGFYAGMKAVAGTYVMQTQGGVQQFYKVAAGEEPTLAPFHAYLQATLPSGARTIGIGAEGEETAIESLNAAVQNGQIYDLSGRRLTRLQKGINIVNGRTVIVK